MNFEYVEGCGRLHEEKVQSMSVCCKVWRATAVLGCEIATHLGPSF